MLIGEYIHALDDKNRLSLPVKFRRELGKKIVITPGLDGCLFAFAEKEWAKIADHLLVLMGVCFRLIIEDLIDTCSAGRPKWK